MSDTSELFSSPYSVCVVLSALATELLLSPLTSCGWGRCCFGVRVPALPCEALMPQPCGHHSRCEAVLRRASRPPSARCHWRRAPWHLFADGVPWLIRPISSQLLRIMISCDSCAACADALPRRQREPLDEFRALLIDRSAELVESFLPSRSRIWRRSRNHQSSAQATDSSRGSLR